MLRDRHLVDMCDAAADAAFLLVLHLRFQISLQRGTETLSGLG